MKIVSNPRLVLQAFVCMLLLAFVGPVLAADLSVGDAAPDFELQGTDGRVHRLGDYKGKQSVVIAWFPKAFTPG